ncbi:hypothetical protein HZS_5241 [Henneguya salminicola]|nr:hypothetical protein HZS_5241 [Henneguya salminicola]
MALIGVCLLPFVLIKRLDMMSVLSGCANALCAFSLTCTIIYICLDLKIPRNYSFIGYPQKYPLFISTLVYVNEGVNMIIPLDNEISDPNKYELAIKISTYGCSFIYLIIGLLDLRFTNIVKVLYALSVLLTFFIQFHIGMKAMIPTLLKFVSNRNKHNFYDASIRIFFAIITSKKNAINLTVVFAIAIPQLNNVISLIGSFAGSSLCLIFPCIIHLATFWNPREEFQRLTKAELIKDFSLIFIGVGVTIIGFTKTIMQIYFDYGEE